ncbi:MAG: hypothetical protein QF752_02035 [Planctomycetota bacterium]|nr:hypothetical protein [Planctomycetota bacterium]
MNHSSVSSIRDGAIVGGTAGVISAGTVTAVVLTFSEATALVGAVMLVAPVAVGVTVGVGTGALIGWIME